MNELNYVVESEVGIVEFNNEEIKKELAVQMQVYKELEVTEDKKQEIKKDIATLRKVKTAIEDRRKQVKKEQMAPYEAFEKKVKELTALIDEPIQILDSKVKVFDEKVLAEKKQLILELFAEATKDCDIAEYVSYERIYRTDWEKVSYSKKAILADMSESITSIRSSIETIKSFQSDCEEKAVQMFIRNGYDIAPVVTYINDYERQKKEILARKEEERRLEEERKAQEQEVVEPIVEDIVEPEQVVEEPQPVDNLEDEKVTATYLITGTEIDFFQMEAFLNGLGVTYERR